MEFLQEVLRGVRKMDDAPADQEPEMDVDLDPPQEDELADSDIDTDPSAEPDSTDEELPDDSELMGDDPTEDPMAGFSDPTSAASGGAPDTDVPDDVAPAPDEDPTAELDDVATNATEDPDRQGAIRSVKKAHLVFKREGDSGYEEMWIYNVGTMKDELQTRKAILAGTDIAPGQSSSPDGSQTYSIWSVGNAEVLHIKGLPN